VKSFAVDLFNASIAWESVMFASFIVSIVLAMIADITSGLSVK
jgi:hypothetical protein